MRALFLAKNAAKRPSVPAQVQAVAPGDPVTIPVEASKFRGGLLGSRGYKPSLQSCALGPRSDATTRKSDPTLVECQVTGTVTMGTWG